jgi:CBS domain-containing protein
MSTGRICSRIIATVAPMENIRAAARRMADHRVGTLVAVEGDRPVGIVTDRDIALRVVAEGLDPDLTPVSAILTTPLRSVHESMPIQEALSLMASAGTRRIVVTGDHGELAGILSLDDVLDLLIEEADTIGRLLGKQQPAIGA